MTAANGLSLFLTNVCHSGATNRFFLYSLRLNCFLCQLNFFTISTPLATIANRACWMTGQPEIRAHGPWRNDKDDKGGNVTKKRH